MTKLSQFEREINIAVNKYARTIPWQDKEDLRQEARIALLEASSIIDHAHKPAAMAYTIARAAIVDSLRKRPPDAEDIDNPSVRHRAEKIAVRFPDIDVQLDAVKAALLTSHLPTMDAILIQTLFGIDCEPRTARDWAKKLNVSEDNIDRRKKRILAKLKAMMTGEKN